VALDTHLAGRRVRPPRRTALPVGDGNAPHRVPAVGAPGGHPGADLRHGRGPATLRTAFHAILKKPPTSPPRQCRAPAAPSPTAAALELLASCRDGCTEALMLAHGFTIEQVVELVRVGLATATTERMVAGNRTIEVARVRITEAGRRALDRQ
jgi:hypothetical protein